MQDNNAMPTPPGTIKPVGSEGSYTTPKPAGEMSNVSKVAGSGGSKSRRGTGNPEGPAQNLGKLGDYCPPASGKCK